MATPYCKRPRPSLEEVRAQLDYNPETGVFTWRTRPPSMFSPRKRPPEWEAKRWNSRYAGKTAGSLWYCDLSRPAEQRRAYVMIKCGGAGILAHRLAWFIHHGEWPIDLIDHRDGDGLNNRIGNLRMATNAQNLANSKRHRKSTTNFKGVSAVTNSNRFRARIRRGGKEHHLGTFDTPEEAHAAYCRAAAETFGEFARGE